MTWDVLAVSLVALALAVGALAGLRRRKGRSRVWYAAGLVVGAVLGTWLLALPEGLLVGLGAAGYGPALVRLALARLLPGRFIGDDGGNGSMGPGEGGE